MIKVAPEWVRTSDPVIRSPARYRWTTAPAGPLLDIARQSVTALEQHYVETPEREVEEVISKEGERQLILKGWPAKMKLKHSFSDHPKKDKRSLCVT